MDLFLLTSVVLLVLGLAVAYSQRSRWLRWVVIFTTIIAVPASYLTGLELIGRAKPVAKEYFKNSKEVTVLGYKIVENVGIYLLLDDKLWSTPIHYFIDWEEAKDLAEGLQALGEEAKATGEHIRMVKPFDKSWGEEEKFKHPDPPTRDPRKDE